MDTAERARHEGAIAIEQLQAEIARLQADNERLKAALKQCAEQPGNNGGCLCEEIAAGVLPRSDRD